MTKKKANKWHHTKIFSIALIVAAIIILIVSIPSYRPNESETQMATTVIFETTKGNIEVEIYEDKTPITSTNFLGLVNQQFYDGLTFHRYVAGFVIQGGDPDGDGTGGSGTNIQLEIADGLSHVAGVIAMARSADPNSASSQFYFTLKQLLTLTVTMQSLVK